MTEAVRVGGWSNGPRREPLFQFNDWRIVATTDTIDARRTRAIAERVGAIACSIDRRSDPDARASRECDACQP
ncbi:MAG TPA: hypothetical protein VIP11_08680 [Gemmatimonadaceae bacterium]